MKTKNWFEVSKKGLRQLQEGKPKHFIARELIQNAWDENIKRCTFTASWLKGVAFIVVTDDSPEGFRDLADTFTLFAPTYKRSEPEKRGRFNLGEKQVLALCDSAKIITTKGSVIFNQSGRHIGKVKTETGSQVEIEVKMTAKEFDEMIAEVKKYIVPVGIDFLVNDERIVNRKPIKEVEASLITEVLEGEIMVRRNRKTTIRIFETENGARLYEMGIPVTEIDCKYDVDVQQKIPLSVDRETVPQSYLSNLYAEVLNATYQDIKEEESSQVWVREAAGNKRASQEAVKEIVNKRYGDKVVVANPFDKNSIDDALSNGYRVVYGSELSKEEWENIKAADAIKSSSDEFGHSYVNAESVDEDANMFNVKLLAQKIAKECLGINISVYFKSWEGSVAAEFGDNVLTFNVGRLGRRFFYPVVNARVIDLIIHEIGHSAGQHTEKQYHEALTKVAGKLVMIALENPKFFET